MVLCPSYVGTPARALLATGLTVREAAARVKVGKTALYEALASLGTEPAA